MPIDYTHQHLVSAILPTGDAHVPITTGGGVSVDNTVDPPAEVTTIVAPGAVIVGSEATVPTKDFYAQDADPGAVGAGSVWKDTTTNSFWERNVTDDGWDARFAPTANAVVDLDAVATSDASASGFGSAYAGSSATATDGNANAGSTATTTDGVANAQPSATATTGDATSAPFATTTDGNASAGAGATALGTGTASVRSVATADGGFAQAGSYAVGTGIVAGISSEVFAGVAYVGFNGTTPIAIPELPATPTEQDIADVLVALGLVTQAV